MRNEENENPVGGKYAPCFEGAKSGLRSLKGAVSAGAGVASDAIKQHGPTVKARAQQVSETVSSTFSGFFRSSKVPLASQGDHKSYDGVSDDDQLAFDKKTQELLALVADESRLLGDKVVQSNEVGSDAHAAVTVLDAAAQVLEGEQPYFKLKTLCEENQEALSRLVCQHQSLKEQGMNMMPNAVANLFRKIPYLEAPQARSLLDFLTREVLTFCEQRTTKLRSANVMR